MVIAAVDKQTYKIEGARRCTKCNERTGDTVYIPYYELRVKRKFSDKLFLEHTRTFCYVCADYLTEKGHIVLYDVPFRAGSWI